MKYIMAEVVSGYDSENIYNFYTLNPIIMIGSQYPLTEDEFDNMKLNYDEKLSMTRNESICYNSNGRIIGYITQEDSNCPLFYIDRRVVDCLRNTINTYTGMIIHYSQENCHRQFLTCYRTEKDCFVELTFLESGNGYIAISLIDIYVLYLEELTKNFLSVELTELIISQISENHKDLALLKYYKEFC